MEILVFCLLLYVAYKLFKSGNKNISPKHNVTQKTFTDNLPRSLRRNIIMKYRTHQDKPEGLLYGLMIPLANFSYEINNPSLQNLLSISQLQQIKNKINSNLSLTYVAEIYYDYLLQYSYNNNINPNIIKAIIASKNLFFNEVENLLGFTNLRKVEYANMKVSQENIFISEKITTVIIEYYLKEYAENEYNIISDFSIRNEFILDFSTKCNIWATSYINEIFDILDKLNKNVHLK